MGIFTKKKNISYWMNYCKRFNLGTVYLVLKKPLENVDAIQQYRIKYHEKLQGYALEVFSGDRFVFAFYTSPWDDSEYIELMIENVLEQEKYILNDNGQWVDKETLNPEPIDYTSEMINRDLLSRDETGKILYYDFTGENNKLQ